MSNKKALKITLAIIISVVLFIIPVIYTLFRMGIFVTEPEIEYLPDTSNDKVLRVVGDKDFAPYSFIGENGKPTGLDVEAITELCNRMGYQAKIELVDRNEYITALRDGRADIAVGRRVTGVTTPGELTSIPFIDDDLVVWSKKEIKNLSGLSRKKIGMIEGAFYRQQYPILMDSTLMVEDSVDRLFEALDKGEVDYVIGMKNVGQLTIYNKDMYFSEPLFFSKSYLGYGLNPGSEFYSGLNIEIEEFYRDGTRAKLVNKWVNYYAGHHTLVEVVNNHLEVYLVFASIWIIWALVVILIGMNDRMYMRELEQESAHKEELEEALVMAEKANESKSLFLFNMSHDIRTPLNAILGSAQLAKEKKDTQGNLDKYIDNIILSGNYLLGVLNDVLEMSRIENNRLVLDEHLVDTYEHRQECNELVHELIGDKDIEYIEINNTTTRYLYADMVHGMEIFINIVSNAVKYTPEGGKLTITTIEKPGRNEDEVFIETIYEDTGIGMSEDFLEHAFESFEREKTTASADLTGTGLGLAIVKRLTDLMNGTIDIVSKKGEGTKVTVCLPHRIGNAPSTEEEDTTALPLEYEGLHVLLAEDNDINAGIVMEFFSDEGIVVTRAKDGEECINILTYSEAGNFDVILMDIQMPNVNGYEATKRIRELDDEKLSGIPIIALTANAFKEDVDKAMEAGMDGHIAKPIDMTKMKEVLHKVLS